MNYTNREVVRRLKQYDMFLNSLKLTKDETMKEKICDQLDRIEKQILLETNSEYEEEYLALEKEDTRLFEDEKNRLRKIIALINNRREYLEEREERHKSVTGSLVELTSFLGEDKLDYYKNKLRIIEKYEENKVTKDALMESMKSLDVRISEASRNLKANARLNDMLEAKMIKLVGDSLEKHNLYELLNRKNDIFRKHSTLGYALDMAKDNLKSAASLNMKDLILDCNETLGTISKEYAKYNEEVHILRLIELYNREVTGYDELLKKRTEIDDILRNIAGTEIYKEINEELGKEYNTIKLEKNDIKLYDDLKLERENKSKKLNEIDEENNSKEFKEAIDNLIRNENKLRDEKIREARRQETLEREKKLKEEQKLEASRLRRQKLIEDARLKDQLERTEKLKEIQEKTLIKPKEEENIVNPLEGKSFDEIELPKEESEFNKIEEKVEIEIPEYEEREKPLFEESKKEEKEDNSFEEVKEDNEDIYDILSDSSKPVWEESKDEDEIPIIKNDKLKPEIVSDSDNSFPKLGSKEDVLWKETL